MEATIRTFEPVAGTLTHVLLDTWYSAKDLWRAARERGFLITSGLKSNRWLQVVDPTVPQGWRWQQLSDYTEHLRVSVSPAQVAKGRQEGLCACGEHTGTQALLLPGRHRAAAPERSRKHAIGPPVIWKPMLRPCSCISRHVWRSKCSLAMARKNWAWISIKGIVNLFVGVGVIAELERGNILQSSEKLGRGSR